MWGPSPSFPYARISFWFNQNLLNELPLLASKLDTGRFTADSFNSLVLGKGLPDKDQVVMAVICTLTAQLQHITFANTVIRFFHHNIAIIISKKLNRALKQCVDQFLSKLFIEMSEN